MADEKPGGYYRDDGGDAALVAEMLGYLRRGYRVVKMKIGGAPLDVDRRRIEAVLAVLEPGQRLAVDANGRFDRDTALAYAAALRDYDLFWYEEPGDPLDYALQAELAQAYPGPLATGENLFSVQDARILLRNGGMRPQRDWLQFDCALSYGLVEYLRILDAMRERGWSPSRCIPHGGHQMSLNIAAGLGLGGNESYPDPFQPFGGFPGPEWTNGTFVQTYWTKVPFVRRGRGRGRGRERGSGVAVAQGLRGEAPRLAGTWRRITASARAGSPSTTPASAGSAPRSPAGGWRPSRR